MANQISLTHTPSRKLVTITIVGDEALRLEELRAALMPLQRLDVTQYMAYRLEGFTPAHFAGWDLSDWEGVNELMWEGNGTGEGLDWHELIEVGGQPPSAERLVELLSSDYDEVRELSLIWMVPRIPTEAPR